MRPIRFYNTLTHEEQTFAPLEPGVVRMYNCGPTVYDYAHIGNFRAFVFADLLRRFLESRGYRVEQVMNITDVGHMTEDQLADGGGEDKMQVASRKMKEAKKQGRASVDDPENPYQVAAFFTKAFVQDARALGLKIAEEHETRMPRATAHIDQMIAMIERLIETGHAYQADDGAVYYSVESFPEYGRRSGNTLDRLRGGAGGRVLDEHQKGKRHPADFLLWKPDPTHLMKWDSPWGAGYPGWHIECSAMATHLLGRPVIDIHTGGEDNIFPHHECEIAQSVGAADERQLQQCGGFRGFARYWLHTRFLLVEGEKMSKSKGNFHTVRGLLEQGVDPAVIRFELLKAHYRSNMNFTRKGLEDSARAVQKLRRVAEDAGVLKDGKRVPEAERTAAVCEAGSSTSTAASRGDRDDRARTCDKSASVIESFMDALADDLNTSGAIGALFAWLADADPTDPQTARILRRTDQILAVLETPGLPDEAAKSQAPSRDGEATLDPEAACRRIDEARAAKDFDTADALRAELIEAGFEVSTTPEGTVARKKLV